MMGSEETEVCSNLKQMFFFDLVVAGKNVTFGVWVMCFLTAVWA